MAVSFAARALRPLVFAMTRRSFTGPIPVQRARLERAARLAPMPRASVSQHVALGGVPARRVGPARAPRALLYLHGGAYVTGSPDTHAALVARLALAADAEGWAVDYRLAPEHPFPAGLEDAVAAYDDLTQRVPAAQVAVMGDSAGGGLTVALLCALRDRGRTLPGCAVLLSPWLDLSAWPEQHGRGQGDPVLTPDWLATSAAMYRGDRPLDDPGISPLFADLGGLPPLLVQAADDEILVGDARALVERALAAGVDATLQLWAGVWHVWQAYDPFLPEARQAVAAAGRFVRDTLPRSDDR